MTREINSFLFLVSGYSRCSGSGQSRYLWRCWIHRMWQNIHSQSLVLGEISLVWYYIQLVFWWRAFRIYRSIYSGASLRTRAESARSDFSCGQDIPITSGRSSFNSVSPSRLSSPYVANNTSNLHDRRLTSRKWLRPRWRLPCPLRLNPRSLLSDPPPNVRIRSHTPRKTRSKETVREWESLGVIQEIHRTYQHSYTVPAAAL